MWSHIRIGRWSITMMGSKTQLLLWLSGKANQVRSCEKCQKQRLKHNKLTPAPPYAATFQVGKIFVTTHLPLAIRNVAYRSEMEEYIIRKARFASRSFCKMVDWESRYRASLKLRGSRKMTAFNVSDLLAMLRRRINYDKKVDNRCFRCYRLNEKLKSCDSVLFRKFFED